MTDVPHFSLPFRFNGTPPGAAVVEQDSLDDIACCVISVLVCPVGFRVELPEFGVPDPTFALHVDVDDIRERVEEWEDRSTVLFNQYPDELDALIRHLGVSVKMRTEE